VDPLRGAQDQNSLTGVNRLKDVFEMTPIKVIISVAGVVLATAGLYAQRITADHHLDIPGHTQSSISPAAPYVPRPMAIVGLSHPRYATSLNLTIVSVEVSDFDSRKRSAGSPLVFAPDRCTFKWSRQTAPMNC